MRWCAVLLKCEVIRRWLLDIWQQVLHQECVTIVLPINLDARVHKVKIRTAQHWRTGMTERRSCAQQALWRYIFLANSSGHVHPVVLRVAWGCDGKYFSSVNHMKFTVEDGYRFSRRRQRSSRACLLEAVSSCARLFRHYSFKSFLMIALRDATEIPIWRAICLCVLWVWGAVSWLNASSSTCSIISANGAQTTTARASLEIFCFVNFSNFCNPLNVHFFLERVWLYDVLLSAVFFCKIELNAYLLQKRAFLWFLQKTS